MTRYPASRITMPNRTSPSITVGKHHRVVGRALGVTGPSWAAGSRAHRRRKHPESKSALRVRIPSTLGTWTISRLQLQPLPSRDWPLAPNELGQHSEREVDGNCLDIVDCFIYRCRIHTLATCNQKDPPCPSARTGRAPDNLA